MPGTQDITELLSGMRPELDSSTDFIFLTVSGVGSHKEAETGQHDEKSIVETYLSSLLISQAVGSFREDEGLTVILPEAYVPGQLARGDSSDVPSSIRHEWEAILAQGPLPRMKRITMKIHSSLTTVGFTAAFSRVLTEEGISCNVIAGYYHDHIFVPSEKAVAAMSALTRLSAKSS